jgi:hypothetical protein
MDLNARPHALNDQRYARVHGKLRKHVDRPGDALWNASHAPKDQRQTHLVPWDKWPKS